MALILPAHVKRAHGRDRWPPPDVLTLASGALLKHHDEWMPFPGRTRAKVYRGPRDLTVIVSLDAVPTGT